jgi:Fe-S-cluster containining protein
MKAAPPSPQSAAERGQLALKLAQDMLAFFDAHSAPLLTNTDLKIACSAGCTYCCRFEVSVSSSEALLALRAIQALPEADQSRISERIEALAPLLRGLNARDRRSLNQSCPLLTDAGACSIYSARPLSCRSHVSFDVEPCRTDAAQPDDPVQIPTSRTLTETRDAIRPRHRELERSIGLPAGRYELVQSLRILLTRADAAGRMARGDDVLRPARLS